LQRTRKWELGFKKIDKFELRTPCTTSFTPLTPRASHLNLKNSWLKKFKLKFFSIHCLPTREVWGLFVCWSITDQTSEKHRVEDSAAEAEA